MARSAAREAAMQLIYEHMMSGSGEETLGGMIEFVPDRDDAKYIETVTEGVFAALHDVDRYIVAFAQDWAIDRLARVDLAILRLAAYELLCMEDIPAAVTINEAVELARKYSTEQSGAFINGVLGNLNRKLEREKDESRSGL